MSGTPSHAKNEPLDRTERAHRWTAALVTALLHGLLLLLMLSQPPITVTPPAGGSGGSRIDVTLLDDAGSAPPAEPEPPHKPTPPKKPKAPRAIKRPQPTPIVQSAEPLPPQAPDSSTEPPTPTAPRRAEVDFPSRPPPGTHPDDSARASAALAAKLGSNGGQSDNPAPAGPNMGVDGFHVYYDLVNEPLLRAWRKQGMTELFLPMPGTRRLMVCPLEVALRRGYGECRMVESDAPELKRIGDAREVINIERVYQRGDMVWSGPGPYR